jgi:hypothetical protein
MAYGDGMVRTLLYGTTAALGSFILPSRAMRLKRIIVTSGIINSPRRLRF